jgi:hypothetical protein
MNEYCGVVWSKKLHNKLNKEDKSLFPLWLDIIRFLFWILVFIILAPYQAYEVLKQERDTAKTWEAMHEYYRLKKLEGE